MSGEQWGEAVDAARHAVGLNLHDATRAIAAAAPLIVADTRRKVADELERKGSLLCDCDGSDSEPTNIKTGEPMVHHCDCAAVQAVETAFPDQRTRHQEQCPPCGNRAIARGSGNGDSSTSKPTGSQPI